MKRFIIAFALCCVGIFSYADECIIPISIVVDGTEDVQDFKTLDATFRCAFSSDNLTSGGDAQFEVRISPEDVASEVITGIKPTTVMVMDLHLTVSNLVTKEQFATTTIRIRGAGKNVSNARRSAARSLSSTNKNVVDFVRESRKNILRYYDSHLGDILNQVHMALDQRQLDRCMWLLSSIPTCIERYGEVISLSSVVFNRYLTLDCTQKLKNAKAAWAASPDVDGARLAISYLAGIDSESTCNQDALALMSEIKAAVARLYESDREKADDIIEFEKELRLAGIDNERARIEAMRTIGVAYGENQVGNNIINQSTK